MIAEKIEANPLFGGGAEIRLFIKDVKAVQSFMNKYIDGKKYSVEFKRKRANRSLDANAYCWVLCHEIAKKLDTYTDEEIYMEAIRKYGMSTIRPEEAALVDDLCRMWDNMGLGNQHVILGDSKISGYVNVKYYWGSSGYNTKAMSRLIDGLVSDAQELGIDTRTPDEIERLKQLWETTDT